jgi:hypothetical protein
MVCKSAALSFSCDLEKWNKLFTEAALGNGILPSHEKPKSAIYPIISAHVKGAGA